MPTYFLSTKQMFRSSRCLECIEKKMRRSSRCTSSPVHGHYLFGSWLAMDKSALVVVKLWKHKFWHSHLQPNNFFFHLHETLYSHMQQKCQNKLLSNFTLYLFHREIMLSSKYVLFHTMIEAIILWMCISQYCIMPCWLTK